MIKEHDPKHNDFTQGFDQIYFVMVAPSHPGNVGAAARALKTMGFNRLVLVGAKPSIIAHPDAIAMASGALDVLEHTLIMPDLATALAPAHLCFALTARTRYIGPPACTIRTAAQQAARSISQQQATIALVVGTERVGLSNDEILHCHYLCHIPANKDYSSLNVAQALQLAAWEFRYALLDGDGHTQDNDAHLLPTPIKGIKHQRQGPARTEQVDAFLQHWFEALEALEVITPDSPKKIPARMTQLFRRLQLQEDEVSLMRGICSAILKKCHNR